MMEREGSYARRWLANATNNHHSPQRRKGNGGEWREACVSSRKLGVHTAGSLRAVAGRGRERCVACGPCRRPALRTWRTAGRSSIDHRRAYVRTYLRRTAAGEYSTTYTVINTVASHLPITDSQTRWHGVRSFLRGTA